MWKKKLAIAIGVFFGVLVFAAVIIPLVVDVDKFRPQIVDTVNQKINGKLELGKLSLSLWGQIRVQADGMTLSDAKGRKLVGVKDVFFHFPFSSIFGGSPLLTLKMKAPEVYVVKDKSGKLNVLSLMKPAEPSTKNPEATSTEAPTSGGAPTSLPSIVTQARFGFEMRDALMSYQDEATDLSSQVKDLNVLVRDLSLNRPTELEIWANLDTKLGKTLTVRGPAKLTGKASPKFNGAALEEASLTMKADLDGIEIEMPGLFHKKKGVAANAEGAIQLKGAVATIEKMVLRFHNAEVNIKGVIDNVPVQPTAAGATPPEMAVKVDVRSNEISLKPWSELVPMLTQYELGGSASLDAQASGALSVLKYGANLAVKQLTAKAPNLKAQPVIEARVKVITDAVEEISISMKAPGNDLQVKGKVVSFTKPRVDVTVTSTGMDLDQLIEFPKKPAAEAAKPAAKETTAAKAGKEPVSDFDAMLDPLRENPIAADTVATIRFGLPLIKVMNVRMKDIGGAMTFKGLAFGVENFKMALFNGKIGADMVAQFKPKKPTYRFNMEVAGIDLKEAVTSQLELFKNTLLGKASFKMSGTGASFNPEPAKVNLEAKGSLSVVDASFATLDIAKVATEAIAKSLSEVGSKIPQLKSVKLGPPMNSESKYEVVSADFTIAKGVFSSPNFYAKSAPGKGIDVKGATTLDLKGYALKADWQVIDTHNLTKARDLSVEQSGVRIENVLAEPGQPVKFPLRVAGTAFAPQPNYTSAPEALAKVALANVGRAVEGRVKAEAAAKAQEAAAKAVQNAPKPVQDAVKGLGKKLFGK